MLSIISNIVKENKSRLEWDDYFMSIALLASCRSPCKRLNVGSVIIKSNRIVSIGYNGFIAGTPHNSIVRDGHEQAIIHSEINALANSNRLGSTSLEEAIIYITHYPCINCMKILCASGIKDIRYIDNYRNDEIVKKISDISEVNVIKI